MIQFCLIDVYNTRSKNGEVKFDVEDGLHFYLFNDFEKLMKFCKLLAEDVFMFTKRIENM